MTAKSDSTVTSPKYSRAALVTTTVKTGQSEESSKRTARDRSHFGLGSALRCLWASENEFEVLKTEEKRSTSSGESGLAVKINFDW